MNQQEWDSDELVSVFQAPDEITAFLVKGVLDESGIECVVRSRQVPWMDGIFANDVGYWGDVLTTEAQREQGLQVIADFQAAALEAEADDPGVSPDENID
jgi:hypothetical protein